MIAGIGVDVVDVARLDAAIRRTPELAERLFTDAERAAASARYASAEYLASCFAAKEALAKVLGAPAGLRWTDAEVVRDKAGRPFLRLVGSVAAEADRQGVTGWHLSLSHDGGLCVAMVVGERQGEPGGASGASEPGRTAR